MCITEIWAYQECGCQYLHPNPCYDRVLQVSRKSYQQSEDWSPVAPGPSSSSSSLSSIDNHNTHHEEQYPRRIRPSHGGDLDHVDDAEAGYNHRLHLARTCSLRRMAPKTFLEPVCDDCLLHELGLVAGGRSVYSTTRSNGSRHDDGVLVAAEWLLESKVEITIEPPLDDASVYSQPFQTTDSCPPSPRGNEDEAPQLRGRGRRRALETGRISQVTTDTSSVKSQSSFNRLKRAGRQLRRAQKQDNLKVSSDVCSTSSQSSKTKPPSWIEHLKSDLGQRIRKKRPDVTSDSVPLHRTESTNDTLSTNAPDEAVNDADDEEVEDEIAGGSEGDTILSTPSVPATASSAYSTTSARLEERIIFPINQLIVPSELKSDSSNVSDQHRLNTAMPSLQVDQRPPVLSSPASSTPAPAPASPGHETPHQPQPFHPNPLNSSARPIPSLRSEKSFHPATSTVSPSPSRSKTVDAVHHDHQGVVEKISLHPFSCPFRARPTCGSTRTFSSRQVREDDFVQGDVRGAWKEGELEELGPEGGDGDEDGDDGVGGVGRAV